MHCGRARRFAREPLPVQSRYPGLDNFAFSASNCQAFGFKGKSQPRSTSSAATFPAVVLVGPRQVGAEVDLLVELNQKLLPIECKRGSHPSARELRGIKRLRQLYGNATVARATVACTAEQEYELAEGVTARSGWTTWAIGG